MKAEDIIFLIVFFLAFIIFTPFLAAGEIIDNMRRNILFDLS